MNLARLLLVILASTALPLVGAAAPAVQLIDVVGNHSHIERENRPVTAINQRSSTANLQWVDHLGAPIGDIISLRGDASMHVSLPSNLPGYYGLLISQDGEEMESGFTVMPTPPAPAANPRARFGVVHAEHDDPWIDSWVKTATWDTYAVGWWGQAMSERRVVGKIEMPLANGKHWQSNDQQALAAEEVDTLEQRFLEYFKADPSLEIWELGLEENLRAEFHQPFYWPNLQAKTRAARRAANKVNPKIRFAYQIAGLDLNSVEQFLSHDVAKEFSILALHPYAWKAFQPPEQWLPEFIRAVRQKQQQHNANQAIWFTEIGAPQHSNRLGGHYGSGQTNGVRGQSRAEAMAFIVQSHVLSLQEGIEKIIWYNYRDRNPPADDPENHFGLRDYYNFPKPAYLAYTTLVRFLKDSTPQGSTQVAPDTLAWHFRTPQGECSVLWNNGANVDVQTRGLTNTPHYFNVVGQPVSAIAGSLRVGPQPLYACSYSPAASNAK